MHWFNELKTPQKKDPAALILLNSVTPAVVLKLLHPPKEGITFVIAIA